ncbi:hypothetical protein EB118_18375 [bacterium]|nr:hypothetical protein [bacterium]NDD83070.1 hypothetical protein [bacterium]NDG32027.1 hypothetical protein [bacterium]
MEIFVVLSVLNYILTIFLLLYKFTSFTKHVIGVLSFAKKLLVSAKSCFTKQPIDYITPRQPKPGFFTRIKTFFRNQNTTVPLTTIKQENDRDLEQQAFYNHMNHLENESMYYANSTPLLESKFVNNYKPN